VIVFGIQTDASVAAACDIRRGPDTLRKTGHQRPSMSGCLGEVKGIPFRGGGHRHACEARETAFADEKNMMSVAGPPT